jgi:hypothetical protein
MTTWLATINIDNNTVDVIQQYGNNVNQQTVIEVIKRMYHITEEDFVAWPTVQMETFNG